MLLSYLADSATFFSFTQCSKDRIFLWEQHVLFSSGKINISECVLLSHWYCKYWNSELFSKTIYCPFNWKTLFFTWSLYYDPFLLFPLIKTWKCYLILHVTSQWTAFSSLNINHEHQPKYFFFPEMRSNDCLPEGADFCCNKLINTLYNPIQHLFV